MSAAAGVTGERPRSRWTTGEVDAAALALGCRFIYAGCYVTPEGQRRVATGARGCLWRAGRQTRIQLVAERGGVIGAGDATGPEWTVDEFRGNAAFAEILMMHRLEGAS